MPENHTRRVSEDHKNYQFRDPPTATASAAFTQLTGQECELSRSSQLSALTKLQALVYGILPGLEVSAGKRCSECTH